MNEGRGRRSWGGRVRCSEYRASAARDDPDRSTSRRRDGGTETPPIPPRSCHAVSKVNDWVRLREGPCPGRSRAKSNSSTSSRTAIASARRPPLVVAAGRAAASVDTPDPHGGCAGRVASRRVCPQRSQRALQGIDMGAGGTERDPSCPPGVTGAARAQRGRITRR